LTIKFAHRKLDQHIVSLTPSSSQMPGPPLDDPKHPEEIYLSWEFAYSIVKEH